MLQVFTAGGECCGAAAGQYIHDFYHKAAMPNRDVYPFTPPHASSENSGSASGITIKGAPAVVQSRLSLRYVVAI